MSRLREAVIAPKGHKIVVVDASQIECRLLNFMAGQKDVIKRFRKKQDVYAAFATDIFGEKITKDSHPLERFIGKTAELQLGYGAGDERFYQYLRKDAPTIARSLTDKVHTGYRNTHGNVVRMWYFVESLIPVMAGTSKFKSRGNKFFAATEDKLTLCTGHTILYPGLELGEEGWTYGPRHKKLYGAKLVENLTQALAFDFVMYAAIRLGDRRHYAFLALQAHDELVYVVPDDRAHEFMEIAVTEMARPPMNMAVFDKLPLDAEGGMGNNYAEAK